MDDLLELPSALPEKNLPSENAEGEDEQSSADEDDGPDWTKLTQNTARPVIPKRGEKDFEPAPGGGSGLQQHVLDRARSAMFDALRATRATSSKNISYAVWYPGLARAHVTLARGIHFSAMGHSAPRSVIGEDGAEKIQKRLELLPEEAIYLVERGSVFCWKESDKPLSNVSGLEDIPGPPMSVQQVYSEMIGTEDLTLEKFQVFAYLKRLGYVVTRTNAPNSFYPTASGLSVMKSTSSFLQRVLSLFPLWASRMSHLLVGAFDWWKPVRISRWLHHDKNYTSLFRSLRFIPAGHGVPLQSPKPPSSPYQIFFNIYKPSTPFKKSAPPQPDFQLVVINARTTPMPTLRELTNLFEVLPVLPPPLPRQRRPPPPAPGAPPPSSPAAPSAPIPTPTAPTDQPLIRRLFSWAFPRTFTDTLVVPPRRPNPFMALKAGKKTIVIAVVDAGSISFFRFGEGAFTEWPMV